MHFHVIFLDIHLFLHWGYRSQFWADFNTSWLKLSVFATIILFWDLSDKG